MTFEFKKAIRENVGLLVALAGASGSGKTYSAMRLAKGIVGEGNRFAVIDTESRRALHYAQEFDFDHCELDAPFRPERFLEAIKSAEKAGYKAIVIDSMSHEHCGDGGLLDWQEEELNRMAGDDYKKREACKMASWIKPKMSHKKMVQSLLQVKATLIFCLRAEEKTSIERENGKNIVKNIGFQPICDKNFMYEMTASFMLYNGKSGIPEIIKCEKQHLAFFPTNKPICEETGKKISDWSRGGITPETKKENVKPETEKPKEEAKIDTSKNQECFEKAKKTIDSIVDGKKFEDAKFTQWLTGQTNWLRSHGGDDLAMDLVVFADTKAKSLV